MVTGKAITTNIIVHSYKGSTPEKLETFEKKARDEKI